MKPVRLSLTVCFFLLAFGLVQTVLADPWGQSDQDLIPSTLSARLDPMAQRLLFLTPAALLKPVSLTIHQPNGSSVVVSAIKVRIGPPDQTLWEIRFDLGQPFSAGSWVIFRDGLDRIREIRIILQAGPKPGDNRLVHTGTWVRLTPIAGRAASQMDVFVAGRLVAGGWELPHELQDFVKMPAQSIFADTADRITWTTLVPHRTPSDAKVEALVTQVGHALSRCPSSPWGLWLIDQKADRRGEGPDGGPLGRWAALGSDENHSAGLGPWGVTAWIGAALCRHWNLAVPDTEALLVERSHLSGYSPALDPSNLAADPSLSLDWIRNIGLAVTRGLEPDRPLTDSGADVQDVPFIEEIPQFGYSVDDLSAAFTLLTSLHPGRIYLASLNHQDLSGGAAGSIRFEPPVVIFPWVGEDQTVHVVIFRGTRKVSWQDWAGVLGYGPGRRPNHVLLIGLPLPDELELPALP